MLSELLGLETGTELSLRGEGSPLLLALLIGAAAVAAVLPYWRQRSLSPRRRIFLGGIRALLYMTLLAALFEPVVTVARSILVPTNVLVLVDVSESMAVRDPRTLDGDRRVEALATGATRFAFPQLQEALARSARSLDELDAALEEPDGTPLVELAASARSDLETALRRCRRDTAGADQGDPGPIDGAPVVSDEIRGRIAKLVERQAKIGERLSAPGSRPEPGSPEQADSRAEVARLAGEVAALLQGIGGELPRAPSAARDDAPPASRMDLARSIVAHPDLGFFRDPDADRRLRYFRFGEHLEPTSGEGEALWESIGAAEASQPITRLGEALEEAVQRYSGQTIDGIVVLTDGGSNDGVDPVDAAARLGDLGIPVYPIGLGLPRPVDVRVRSLVVQDTVFDGDRVPVKVEVYSRGFSGKTAEVSVSLDGDRVARRTISLSEGSRFVSMDFVPRERSGTVALQASIAPQDGEVTTDNNSLQRALRVIDEKIKVLYVEGRPRWEYRYLRTILLRDDRLDVRLLLTEGDPDLARASPLYIGRFPQDPSDAERFDLVILGDVPSYYFTTPQLEWVADLVRRHGGSLLVVTGNGYGPGTFRGTPVADVLPVQLAEGWIDVSPAAHPRATAAGARSLIVQLDPSTDRNAAVWSMARPLYRVPRFDGVKPGATILAALSDRSESEEPYPLVVWQRYGTGKALLVATDQLWRLRFRQGDTYHARFWGQAIRFLTLSRLLGENKRIRLEVEQREHLAGERIEVYANVLSDTYDPLSLPAYEIEVQEPESRTARPLALQPVPGTPGLYRASFRVEGEGTYVLQAPLADRPYSQPVEIVVKPSSREQLEPQMQEEVLRKVAELSGGQYIEIGDLPTLPARFRAKPRRLRVAEEKELWDYWGILAFLLAGAGLEWFLRRRSDLA